MKIALMSDLHLEITRDADSFKPDVSDAEVVVLAGDIHKGVLGLDWAHENFDESVYVAGNHEFYHGDRWNVLKDMKERDLDGVHFLERQVWQKDDVAFVGATLWTDYDFYGRENRAMSMFHAERSLNDHYVVTNWLEGSRWLPEHALRDHQGARKFIEDKLIELKEDDSVRAVVVISHHVPSKFCVNVKYAGDALNGAFCSDLDEIMHSDYAPDIWCFGHTHFPFDVEVGNTRLLCNPRGYQMVEPEVFVGYEPLIFEV